MIAKILLLTHLGPLETMGRRIPLRKIYYQDIEVKVQLIPCYPIAQLSINLVDPSHMATKTRLVKVGLSQGWKSSGWRRSK